MEKEIIQAIKDDRLYDYISINYCKISKRELRDLILEIYYILRCEIADEDINGKIVDYLKENRDWESD